MQNDTQNSAQLERLLNQLATFCDLLKATGGQMQDLALQIQDLGGETKATPPAKDSSSEKWGLKKIFSSGEGQNFSSQRELAGQIAELRKKLERKEAEIKDLNEKFQKNNEEFEAKFKAQKQEYARLTSLLEISDEALKETQAENEELQKNNEKLEAKFKEQWNETARVTNLFEKSDAENCSLNSKLTDTRNELAGAKDSLEKYSAEFRRIQGKKFTPLADSIDHIPEDIKPMVQSYYEIGNLPEFLTQCGHFGRLAQLWQACRSNIINGENLEGIERFLLEILNIYNNAFPENTGHEKIPAIGSMYDYNTQERVGSNGTRVARVILPGLVQPNGQVAVKALVVLE